MILTLIAQITTYCILINYLWYSPDHKFMLWASYWYKDHKIWLRNEWDMTTWSYEQFIRFPASMLSKNIDYERFNRWIIVKLNHEIEDTTLHNFHEEVQMWKWTEIWVSSYQSWLTGLIPENKISFL